MTLLTPRIWQYQEPVDHDSLLAGDEAPANGRSFAPAAFEPPFVLASLAYLIPTGERPVSYAYPPPHGEHWESHAYENREVVIRDARNVAGGTWLHREGFELRYAPSVVRDFSKEDEVLHRYYPEVAELALAATGAHRAYVFDHLVRRREAGRPPLTFGRASGRQQAGANGRIHNDYSEDSGRRRLRLVLGEEEARDVVRYAIVNVWRAIRGPVLDTPLAVCDARTVDAADLVAAEVRYPRRSGEIYLLTSSNRHRWLYYSGMDRDEALVFKQYDSQTEGVARFTPHAAFDHPDAPTGAPPRESIEARCLVVFE